MFKRVQQSYRIFTDCDVQIKGRVPGRSARNRGLTPFCRCFCSLSRCCLCGMSLECTDSAMTGSCKESQAPVATRTVSPHINYTQGCPYSQPHQNQSLHYYNSNHQYSFNSHRPCTLVSNSTTSQQSALSPLSPSASIYYSYLTP